MLLNSIGTNAQQKSYAFAAHKGLLRAEASLAYGSGQNNRYYVQGELEYLVQDKFGWMSESYFNIGPDSIYPKNNHSLFSGPCFHAPMGKHTDFSTALQPGLSFISSDNPELGKYSSLKEIVPNISLCGTLAYYGSFFHVFMQLRGNFAYVNDAFRRQNISDLRLSFGLGWNLNTR